MKIKIGDTLTLLSQGYHGESAAGLFPVRGILKFPSPQLNNFGAYISLKAAQNFFSAPGMVTSNVIIVNDYKHVDKLNSSLQEKFPDYNFMTWKQIQPELLQMIEGDRAGGVVMKLVLYLVIGFGILGTVIMMMSERRREMGITIAIGMQKYILMGTLFFETLYISLVGVIGGFLFSIPVISIMERNPILLTGKIAVAYEQFGIEPVLYFAMLPKVFIEQAVIVFIITFVIVFYPITKVSNMKIINAIRA